MILDPELETKIPSRKLDYPGQLQRVGRRLRAVPQIARVRIAREQTLRIGALTREAEALERELIRAQRPELLAEAGCGPLTAAILIGQTAGAERFKSDAHFARLAGVAPINRQINRALHIIAITRGRLDPETRAYLQRKEAEGKSRMEAMRCLKRHSPAGTSGCSANDRDSKPPVARGPVVLPSGVRNAPWRCCRRRPRDPRVRVRHGGDCDGTVCEDTPLRSRILAPVSVERRHTAPAPPQQDRNRRARAGTPRERTHLPLLGQVGPRTGT